jgi:hypothetical protein
MSRIQPLPALSLPANSGAEESQQLLVSQGHGGPAPGNGQVQGQDSGTSEGSRNSVGPASDWGMKSLDFGSIYEWRGSCSLLGD